jgi:hypothetical protein
VLERSKESAFCPTAGDAEVSGAVFDEGGRRASVAAHAGFSAETT